MALLEVMEMEIHPSLGGKLSERDVPLYKEAKEEFISQLDCSLTGIARIKAIYELVDALTDQYLENNSITCQQGCSWCCYQLVCCTKLEMELILEYFQTLPRSKWVIIKREANKAGRKYRGFYRSSTGQSGFLVIPGEIDGPMRSFYRGKPCMYLKRGKCLIYPVRPIDCRKVKAISEGCGPIKGREIVSPKGINLFVDQVASDLIMEEEKRTCGQLRIVALPAWSVSNDFAQNFS